MRIARHTGNGEPECDVTIVHLCGREEMVPGQLQAPTSQVALAKVLSIDNCEYGFISNADPPDQTFWVKADPDPGFDDKRELPSFQNMKFLHFFPFFVVVIFALLDPDSADQNQCGSGSTTLI